MLTRQTFVGPWAGLPVAWNDNDEFDEKTYRDDVARCCQVGVPGVYTGGTTGEFYAQEIDEFEQIARATVETCREFKVPVMIGCTATSTRGAVRRAELAARIGADAIQVALPFWMEISDADVLPFFRTVADAAGELSLSIYETMRAKKCLTIEQHYEIYETLPQYRMVKANAGTNGNTVEGCRALSDVVNVFVGEDRWEELGPFGAVGGCSSLVYWNPQVIFSAWRCLCDGEWAALKQHCDKLKVLCESFAQTWDDRGFTDSAIDRIGALSNGFLQTSLRMRGPYPSPTKADVETMRALYLEHYPEMLESSPTPMTNARKQFVRR